jgi:hypothetical protein
MALAALRILWFLWRGAKTREARMFGVRAARVMYFGGGGLLIVCGLCFWGWGAMVFFDQDSPRSGPQLGQAYVIPKPVTRPPASVHSLTEPVELEPGYWIRPPRDYVAQSVDDKEQAGHLRRVHCWRHPDDPQQFVAFVFCDDAAPRSFLSAEVKVGDAQPGQFLVEQFHQRLKDLGGPTLAPESNTDAANFDGLLVFGKRTRHGQNDYGAVYYAGCDNGKLIEFICCEKGHSGMEVSFRSFERRK